MALPHEFNAGVDVYSRDGEKLGTLHRVILRRGDLAVTHVVIDVGFLRSGHALWEGGLGLEHDRIVPVEAVDRASGERLELRLSARAFKDAPEYVEESFEEPHDLTPNEFDIPDIATRAQGLASLIGSTSGFWLAERLNKAVDEVEVQEGTPVWRREPHEKLGEIDRVLVDPATGRLRAFVIRRGFLSKRDVVLPVRYIAEIHDDLVRVDIPDAELDRLQEHPKP